MQVDRTTMQQPNPETLDHFPAYLAQWIYLYGDNLEDGLAAARELIAQHAETAFAEGGAEILERLEAKRSLDAAVIRFVRKRLLEVADAPSMLEADNEEIERLRRERDELEEEVEEKDRALQDAHGDLQEAHNRIGELEDLVEKKERAITAVNEDLEEAEEEIAQLEQWHEDLKHDYEKVTSSGQEQIEALNEVNTELHDDLEEVASALDVEETDAETLVGAINNLKAKVELDQDVEKSDASESAPEEGDEDDKSAPDSPHEWQSRQALAEKLDKTPTGVAVVARHTMDGNDVDTPIERKEVDEGKLYRVIPESEQSDQAEPEDESEPNEDDDEATYLVGDEVPGGMIPDVEKPSREAVRSFLAGPNSNYDEQTCDPVILRVTGSVPALDQRLTWDQIDANERMEVVQ